MWLDLSQIAPHDRHPWAMLTVKLELSRITNEQE
jgi:hypothetical protein